MYVNDDWDDWMKNRDDKDEYKPIYDNNFDEIGEKMMIILNS